MIDEHREDVLKQVCEDIVASDGQAMYLPGRVTSPVHLRELVELAASDGRSLDILVNNAGVAGPPEPLLTLRLEDWESTLAVNLTVFLVCKEAFLYLVESGHGRIVTIGSGIGTRPLVNRAAYKAAKLGLVGLTRTLAAEVGPLGVTVNVVSPFLVENARLEQVITTMSAKRKTAPEQLHAELHDATVLRRPVSEAEVQGRWQGAGAGTGAGTRGVRSR